MLNFTKNLIKLILLFVVIIQISAYAEDGEDSSNNKVSINGNPQELSLNFRNVDIGQFIESVAKLTGKNFLVDRRVSGRITIIASQPIEQESLYDVMLSVLQFYGYTAIEDGDITKIIPFAEGQSLTPSDIYETRHSFMTEIVKIRNLNPVELIKVVRPMLSKQAQLRTLAKGNSLIISDTQANIARVKKVIAKMDVIELQDYEVIQLQNAQADAIISMVNAIYKANNAALNINMQADKRTNRIIVSASSSVRKAIKELINSLDTPLSSNANIKVIYLRYADAQNLANILNRLTSSEVFKSIASGQNEQGNSPKTTNTQKQQQKVTEKQNQQSQTGGEVKSGIQADTSLNALIISGDNNFIDAVESIIRNLDVKRAQIIIEVIIAELTDEFRKEFGVDWAYNGPLGGAALDLSGRIGSLATSSGNIVGTGANLAAGGLFGAVFQGTTTNGWGALYKLLNSDTRSNILATPYIVTLDNEEASFIVGENRPFVTGTVTGSNDQVTRTIERRDVGINMVITPQVTGGDTVKLSINQEISNVLPGADSGEDVITTTRKITTNVQVRDGGLIILGGLLSDTQTEDISKLPGLGDVPYLGYLYRDQQTQLSKTNLMIFMRPRIIKDEAAIASLSHGKYNSFRQTQLSFPLINTFLSRDNIPRLKDLNKITLFTDLGNKPKIEDLIETTK